MSRFISSILAGGFAMSALTFTIYKSSQDTVDYVQDRAVQMRCTLEPRLRFHLLKDEPKSSNENNSSFLNSVDLGNVYAETDRQITGYKTVWNRQIEAAANWLIKRMD